MQNINKFTKSFFQSCKIQQIQPTQTVQTIQRTRLIRLINFRSALLLLTFWCLCSSPDLFAQAASESETLTANPISYTSSVVTSDETARCLNCHASRQIKLVETWEKSSHAKNGVGCYECHKANPADPAAKNGHFSFSVQLSVSPLTCASCHPEQYASFASSSHAMAFATIKDLPLATESPIFFETSCAACHGNELQMKRGRILNNTWPNNGIGRVNTDGSRGNCAACHGHHDDSLERVRSPETCGRCHFGNTGPAYESWKASSHGNDWLMTASKVDLNKKALKPVNETLMRPDCFTCHLAPGSENATATHNPSERLSWKLAAMQGTHTENWGQKRMQMQASCRNCHASTQVDQYYRRLDASVLEFNRLAEAAVSSFASNTASFSIASNSRMLDKIKRAAMKGRIGEAMLSPLHTREAVEELRQQ